VRFTDDHNVIWITQNTISIRNCIGRVQKVKNGCHRTDWRSGHGAPCPTIDPNVQTLNAFRVDRQRFARIASHFELSVDCKNFSACRNFFLSPSPPCLRCRNGAKAGHAPRARGRNGFNRSCGSTVWSRPCAVRRATTLPPHAASYDYRRSKPNAKSGFQSESVAVFPAWRTTSQFREHRLLNS
jgi:hypothetical protein